MKKRLLSGILIFTMLSILLTGCTTGESGTSQKDDTGHSSEMTEDDTDSKENSGNANDDGNQEENETLIDYVDTNGYLNNDEVYVVGVEKLPYSQEEIYQALFTLNNRIEIAIDITDGELQKLQQDYEKYTNMGSKSPIYREASMNISITNSKETITYHIPHIGVRMKGNTSRTSFYNSHDGQYNLIHLRIKFEDGDFATLENLEMKWNRNDDSTYVREIYAYDMYRALGILAPRVNLASTDMGGVHQGVFNIYEPVDKNFIKRYVAEKDQDGDLYKCAWAHNGASLTKDCSVGIEDEDQVKFYNYDLKTNKKSSNHEQMKNLLEVLNSSNVTKQQLEEVVDMESFLQFAAISYFVGNPDDIRNDYNNYYIYFLKSSGKAIFIPYDCDRVLGVTQGWNPTGDGMTGVSPFSKMAEGAREDQKNPLFRLTVDEGGYYIQEYILKLKQVAASKWMTTDCFNEYYYIASTNYFNYTTPDKEFHNAQGCDFYFSLDESKGLNTGDGNASFAEYVTAKLNAFYQHLNNWQQ